MTEVKERPILFSGPMVRAILAGHKTQTRRVAKPVRHPDLGNLYDPGALVLEGEPKHVIDRACPYGQPGDRLWVRETWSHANNRIAPYSPGVPVHYRADYLDEPDGADGELAVGGKYRFWLPSIHMPRSASRLVLEITGIRVEKLQQISSADAKAEGTVPDKVRQFNLFGADATQRELAYRDAAVDPYRRLWEEINGMGSWHKNPWVWVVEFGVLIGHETEDR
jgi:hypothetical protein